MMKKFKQKGGHNGQKPAHDYFTGSCGTHGKMPVRRHNNWVNCNLKAFDAPRHENSGVAPKATGVKKDTSEPAGLKKSGGIQFDTDAAALSEFEKFLLKDAPPPSTRKNVDDGDAVKTSPYGNCKTEDFCKSNIPTIEKVQPRRIHKKTKIAPKIEEESAIS